MITRVPLLLNLDFATKEIHSDEEIRAALEEKDRGAVMVRATTFGAPVAPTGSPRDWEGAADAVFRVAHEVERANRAQGGTVRVIVTGRAGLPLFVQLGAELSGRALDLTLLDRRQTDATWDRLDFGPAAAGAVAGGGPFFEVREGFELNASTGRVAVTVSTGPARAPGAARTFLEKMGEPVAGCVEIRTHQFSPDRQSVKYLDRDTAQAAAAELAELFERLTRSYPGTRRLAVFVDGPSTLAFLVGRAIVLRRNHSDVWVPSFHDGEYHDAIRLPHLPKVDVFVIHDRSDAAFVERLDKKPVWARWRLAHAGLMMPGDPMESVSRRWLDAAEIVVVVVSPSSLSNKEAWALVQRALDRRSITGTRVIPLLARQCDWKGVPQLTELRPLPSGERWLESPGNDPLWAEVDAEIRRTVEEVRTELFGEAASPG